MSLVAILNLLVQIAGVLMLCVCLAHFYFARLLDWRSDTKKLKPINQQVFFAHTLFITVGMALLGFVCLFFAHELTAKSTLATIASLCFTLCWISRLIFQFIFFTSALTDDIRTEKPLRLAGTLLWFFLAAVFATLFAYQIGVISN
jgi:hypothetical protein